MGISLPFFVYYLLILTDPGLQRSGTLLHWFVFVVLPIFQDKLRETDSFILLCMHALNLNSNFLIILMLTRIKSLPRYVKTQIDQLSPADVVLQRPWTVSIKQFKLIFYNLDLSITGVRANFCCGKKR